MREALRALVAAFAFGTRVPVGRLVVVGAADVGRGAALFPLVGLAVGGLSAGVGLLLADHLPTFLAATLAVAAATAATGAIHIDGLADAADGLGGDTPERSLEIMRDHAVGAFGLTAVVLDLLLRVGVTAVLLERERGAVALIACAALARATCAPLSRLVRAARREGDGSGASFGAHTSAAGAVLAVVLGVGLPLLLLGTGAAVRAIVAAVLVAALVGIASVRRLGGVTGDVYGATIELAETLALLAVVAT